jgi:DNA-binding LytR/AlgR family response regulator
MINCIALDDEPLALEAIKVLCKYVPFIHLTGTFCEVSLAQKHLNNFPVDLILLDIEMSDLNGFDFLKSIKQDVMVIFTTAHSRYAIQGFNVNAIDYLLKPIEIDRFIIACNKAKKYFEYSTFPDSKIENFLYVRSNYSLLKINHDEILYVETMDDYIKINTLDGKKILTLMSLKKILEKLPKNKFIRVHRSFAVSISNISSVRNQKIIIGDIHIPIGTKYKKEIPPIYSPRN